MKIKGAVPFKGGGHILKIKGAVLTLGQVKKLRGEVTLVHAMYMYSVATLGVWV